MASTVYPPTLYCLCREEYDPARFMIECEQCKDWFHGSCVGIEEYQASEIEVYHCPDCEKVHGPIVFRKRRSWQDMLKPRNEKKKGILTGTAQFIKELKSRHFSSADEFTLRLSGYQLSTPEYLEANGFEYPILVEKKDGLGLIVPPTNFSFEEVEELIGSMREIDVIDVERQEDFKMLMKEWVEYFNSPNRPRVLNVISLEFSQTKLSQIVVPPTIVRDLSWVGNVWPDVLPDDCPYTKPEVQKYCLMGVKDSFTDFHVDFGGTSVWYHVLRGEKVFYLIRPTPSNLRLYENWVSSANQSAMFFGDQVDACYKCVVKQGQTLFLPPGWIHGVLTPIDSLVFGGNFLHSLNIPMQLEIYELEKRVNTPEKFLFPHYETTCWYGALHILELLKDFSEGKGKPPDYVVVGARALAVHLKAWSQRKDQQEATPSILFIKNHKHEIPETIQCAKLLKDLNKILKLFEKQPKSTMNTRKRPERLRKKKGGDSDNDSTSAVPPEAALKDVKHQADIFDFKEELEENDKPSVAPLKVRIPKEQAKTEPEISSDEKPTPVRKRRPGRPARKRSLKLKLSRGQIVSSVGSQSDESKSGSQSYSSTAEEVIDEVARGAIFSPPQKIRRKGEVLSTPTKPGSLKLRLSLSAASRKSHLADISSQDSSTDNINTSFEPDAERQYVDVMTDDPMPAPVNSETASLNAGGGIADILKASGYSDDSDFMQPASPSTRDAIQGMLSIATMGAQPPLLIAERPKRERKIKYVYRDDTGENMQTVFRDNEFIYPTLDVSDDEMELPRTPQKGRLERDDTWNPKAKLGSHLTPKMNRPHREGVVKQAVQSGLAAAAERLAHQPPPKRAYHRKKPPPAHRAHQLVDPELALPSTSSTTFSLPKSSGVPPHSYAQKQKIRTKKGFATAKQRLGRILKIHKMVPL